MFVLLHSFINNDGYPEHEFVGVFDTLENATKAKYKYGMRSEMHYIIEIDMNKHYTPTYTSINYSEAAVELTPDER